MPVFEDIKTMLDINIEDTSNDKKINIIIEDGKQHLRSFNPLLSDDDFEKPTRARYLLSSYCRYAYSNASEMFDINYKAEILALRQEYEVQEYENKNSD